MSKEKGKTQNKKRKLTRQEKKQIDALIRQSKGDGKPHTAQDSIRDLPPCKRAVFQVH